MTIELTKEEAELIIQAHIFTEMHVDTACEIGFDTDEGIYIIATVIESGPIPALGRIDP